MASSAEKTFRPDGREKTSSRRKRERAQRSAVRVALMQIAEEHPARLQQLRRELPDLFFALVGILDAPEVAKISEALARKASPNRVGDTYMPRP